MPIGYNAYGQYMEGVFYSRMLTLPYVLLHLVWFFVFSGDGITHTVGCAFSTTDENNSGDTTNCATTYSSGWWFNSHCSQAALNDNEYNGNPLDTYWYIHNGSYEAADGAPATQLKIRPCANCP